MASTQKIIHNLYRDSVSLMQVSAMLSKLPGVQQASVVMATENNLALLEEAGLIAGRPGARPNDLLIVVQGEDETALEAALAEAESVLDQQPASVGAGGGRQRMAPRSIEMSMAEMPAANLALISTPGEYAGAEALKALRLGLHVLLFSDNVSLEDEIQLKTYAREHDLIVMGPDCGTAIINGIPLAFANVVRRGDIGVVGASGTGIQQVTSLIDRYGKGISQAIGTGGHDLHTRVGGISMLQGLRWLAGDPDTRVIVLISKPPAPEVARRVLEAANQVGKPVVINFLGADAGSLIAENIYAAQTLEEAALAAVALSEGRQPAPAGAGLDPVLEGTLSTLTAQLKPQQRFIRGLYSGGTFCYEAVILLSRALGQVYSNTPVAPQFRLENVWQSQQHTLVDLGDDVFTRGRPHPMIDHRLRNERIQVEAADAETGVILLDVVLGYGSHPEPATEMIPAIEAARKIAAGEGRSLVFVGSVCGTESDPQNLARQEGILRQAGVLLAESNAQAVRLAAEIVSRVNVVS